MSIQMKPEMYWEWRTSVEELQHEELKLNYSKLQLAMMEKDIEIGKLKSVLYRGQAVKNAQDRYDSVKKGYEIFRQELEKELGVDLKNKVIDEFTYEVKDIDEPKN
jgi:hypothetical protein